MGALKNILLVFAAVLFLTASDAVCQTTDVSGIQFLSKNVERSERTSLFLNEGKSIELTKSFSISFDISFWDYRKFGPILRIENEQGNEIRVVYNQFKDDDTSYIQIIDSRSKNQIDIALAKKNLIRNYWFNFKLIFDRNSNYLKAYWENFYVDGTEYSLDKNENFSFVFGIKDIGSPNDFDVPGISIKNILITEQGIRKYFWSLNPFKENVFEDDISRSEIKIINPNWVYEDHKNWKKSFEKKISNHPTANLGVAFDSLNLRLFIDGRDSLIIHNLISGKDSIIKYKSTSPANWNDLFYDNNKQILYSYFTGLGKVSIYDLKLNEWIVKDELTNTNGHYFGSAKFSYPEADKLFILGGYGWYKAKNDLFSYDFTKQKWVKVNLKKNEMSPRAWFAFGKGFRDGEYFIYGGFGNETGDQEKGFKSNYDLFLLNMNDSTITKLELPEQKFNYVMLYNDSYLDKEDSSFYFLSQNEEAKGISISLNKLDLITGKVAIVGNKFWNGSMLKWMYSYLHYNKATNEFISVIFDTTTVELYSINYPPISESEGILYEQNVRIREATSPPLLLMLGGIISISGILIIYFYSKRKPRSVRQTEYLKSANRELINALIVFGGFKIYDKKGKELSQLFSPKLKEIFLLILIKSLNNHHSGITSEELSSTIWPDASPENAKSNRGVAINKIRKILLDVEGISVEFLDKVWVIKIQNSFWFDYAEYLRLQRIIKNDGNDSGNLLIELMQICEEGELLKGISYEWLDSIKFALNNEIIAFLKSFFSNGSLMQDSDNVIRLCDAVLSIDIVDEDAFKTKIQTLAKEGRHQIAKNAYNLFIAEYKRLYDEDYPISFQEILPQ